jgi:hypothetical protein
MSEDGLLRVDGVVVLSGPALKAARDAALIAARNRKQRGIPAQTYEALACVFNAAMAATGQSDVRSPATSQAVPVEQPTVPIAEAAVRLDMSTRQVRRLALRLGGKQIAGRWLVDETALQEHIEGRRT